MASSRIKGITIEIDGNTTKLTEALKKVDKNLRSTQTALRDVNRLLKFNPGNTELVAQKQKLLAEAISDTKAKLEQEKEALAQLQNAPNASETVKQQQALTREIADTESKLQSLENQYAKFGNSAAGKLQGVKNALSQTKSEMDQVNKALKLNPTSTELLKQKQELLAKTVEQTKEKLELEKQALQELENVPATDATVKQQQALKREIAATEGELKNAQQAQRDFGSVSSQQLIATGQKWQETGGKIQEVGESVTTHVSAPLAGVGLAAAKVSMDFDAQMSRVKAISGATGKDFDKLRDQAIDLGAKTSFSAKEAAEGMENLASAGFSTKEIMQAMPGMLDLAASSGEDLATSSDIAASAIRGFGLKASDAGHVADVLAQNAAKTNAAVGDTGEALKYVAPVARSAGWSFEEVTAAVGIMANAGIKGSQAGTTLRGALTRLMKPTKQVKQALEDVGVSVYDSSGKMKPLGTIIGDLKEKMKGMTDEQKQQRLATIFGTNAMSGMMALVNSSPGEIEKLTKSYKSCDGAADKMAKTMQGNTKGSIEAMKGSLETAGIKIGETLAPSIIKVCESVEKLANAFSSLPQPVQEFIVKAGAVTAAVGPMLMGIGGAMKTFGNLQEGLGNAGKAFSNLGTVIGNTGIVDKLGSAGSAFSSFGSVAVKGVQTAATGIGNAFKAIGGFLITPPLGVIVLIAAVVAALVVLYNKSETFRNFVNGAVAAIKSVVLSAFNGIKAGFTAFADAAKSIWDGIVSVVTTVWDTIKNVVQVGIMFIAEIIKAAVTIITLPFQFIWENCKDIIIAAWEAIKNAVSTAFNAVANVISTVGNAIKTVWETIWNAISNFFKTIWDGIVAFFTPIINAIKTVIITVLSAIQASWQRDWKVIQVVTTTVWNAIKTVITVTIDAIKSVVTTVLNAIKAVFTTIWNGIKAVVTTVWNGIKSVVSAGVNALKTIITPVLNAIKNTFSTIWNGIKSVVSNVWNGIKSVVSSGANAIRNAVSGPLNAIKNLFSNIWNGAANIVRNAINRMKGFTHFSWSLPHLKLPHFHVSGSFSLDPPSVPHFGVSWYAKAMNQPYLFTDPTVVNGRGFGDAGPEMVYGQANLMRDIRDATGGQEIANRLDTLTNVAADILQSMGYKIVLDGNALVGELTPRVDRELGRLAARKGRS